MKTIMTFEIEDKEDILALANAVRNQARIDMLYDCIFRPPIKYGTDDKEIEIAEKIWELCREHFEA